MTDRKQKSSILELRLIGGYGHFVMPLRQLLDDMGIFLDGVDLKAFGEETICIENNGLKKRPAVARKT